jgi:hypothetical protein
VKHENENEIADEDEESACMMSHNELEYDRQDAVAASVKGHETRIL